MSLPDGSYITCSGILRMMKHREADQNLRRAVKMAEEAVGKKWSDEENRKIFVRMIELNLINRKENDRETLNRRYGMAVTNDEFWKEKAIFCRVLLEEVQMLKIREKNRGGRK